jgi:hypothetical protein
MGDTVTVASFESEQIDGIISLFIVQRDSFIHVWYYDNHVYVSNNIWNKDSLMTLENGDTCKRIIVNFAFTQPYW